MATPSRWDLSEPAPASKPSGENVFLACVGVAIIAVALVIVAVMLNRTGPRSLSTSGDVRVATMASRDDCPKEGNVIITLEPGDRVQVYQSIAPTESQYSNLPSDSPLSKKLYLTYVKAVSGVHAGEYCWVSTVNIQGMR